MRPKVKICGIRTESSAVAACRAGADFIGLNFVPASRRKVTPEQARSIAGCLPPGRQTRVVGIFQDQELEYINEVAEFVGLDIVQLHGGESPEFVSRVDLPVIKAFGLDADFNVSDALSSMSGYKVETYLIDRSAQGKGEPLNLHRVGQLTSRFPIMLAGGICESDIPQILERSRPYGIDVASGVETDGEIDDLKVVSFLTTARGS
jgi:phosphoribosylanthranilate isomerase